MTASEVMEQIGKGYLLAVSPEHCEFYDYQGRASGICISPEYWRELVPVLGWRVKLLPQYSWHGELGQKGWIDLLFPGGSVYLADSLRRLRAFDFFVLTPGNDGMTIRQYCEQNHTNDDLESLYFVLEVQFAVKPDDELSPELRAVLVSLQSLPTFAYCTVCKKTISTDEISAHACKVPAGDLDAEFSEG